jgi:hypothetical protein
MEHRTDDESFCRKGLAGNIQIRTSKVEWPNPSADKLDQISCVIMKHPKTGAIITDDQLRMVVERSSVAGHNQKGVLENVYAIGDCAVIEDTSYPATAQVAEQKASWLPNV